VIALQLDLSIPPDWSRIDPTREAVGLLVMAMFGDDDLRDALAMVSEELLENAIKYCKPDSVVSLSIRHQAESVIIAVTNAVEEGSRHLGTLRKRIEWMRSFGTATEAYSAALARVGMDDAGLGIVRIAYEGRCGIDYDLSEPGKLTVRAECQK
jgi:hypothetical protein